MSDFLAEDADRTSFSSGKSTKPGSSCGTLMRCCPVATACADSRLIGHVRQKLLRAICEIGDDTTSFSSLKTAKWASSCGFLMGTENAQFGVRHLASGSPPQSSLPVGESAPQSPLDVFASANRQPATGLRLTK